MMVGTIGANVKMKGVLAFMSTGIYRLVLFVVILVLTIL